MTDIALLPCPFCGAPEEEIMMFCDPDEGRDNSGLSRRVQCAVCHIEAPFYPTEVEAIAAWNRRASPSQVAPANPAQVTDAIPAETLRQLDVLFGRTTQGSWRTYQNGVHPVEVGGMGSGEDYAICTHGPKSFANADWIATMHDEWPGVRAALTAAIGAGGQAVAWRVRPMPGFAWAYIEGDPDHNPAIRDYERQPLYTHPAPSGQAVAELHGPYGWLNGCRGLSEDSWTLESDPLENSAEYFAIPLYALVDPFKEIGKDFDGKPALHRPSPAPTAQGRGGAMMELMADLFREVKENPELASGLALREQGDV